MGSTCMYIEPKYMYIEYEHPGIFINKEQKKTIKLPLVFLSLQSIHCIYCELQLIWNL